MLEARELRIGNLVYVDGFVTEIETISKTGINISDICPDDDIIELASFDDINLEPIPLTEKWRNKFNLSNFPFEIFKNGNGVYFVSFEEGYQVNLEYVHTLQNLIYALTGEELEIN